VFEAPARETARVPEYNPAARPAGFTEAVNTPDPALLTDNQLPPCVTAAVAAGRLELGGASETLRFWEDGGGKPGPAENESVVGLTTSDEGTAAATVSATGTVRGLLDAPETTTAIDPE
jgi:hypothetical protein